MQLTILLAENKTDFQYNLMGRFHRVETRHRAVMKEDIAEIARGKFKGAYLKEAVERVKRTSIVLRETISVLGL